MGLERWLIETHVRNGGLKVYIQFWDQFGNGPDSLDTDMVCGIISVKVCFVHTFFHL